MVRYSRCKLARSVLVGARPHYRASPSIFIAFSFNSNESQLFRDRCEREIQQTITLGDVKIFDGRVPPGKSWPGEIRKRLEKAWLVVADLTLLSPEVLFECGFAWGLGRILIPVTRTPRDLANLPEWIRELQFGHFDSEQDWRLLLDSIGSYLRAGSRPKRAGRFPIPVVPTDITLLQGVEGFDLLKEQVETMSSRYGLAVRQHSFEAVSLDSEQSDLLTAVSSSSLVVAPIDGVASDSFVHFAAGLVAARPKAGVSQSKLYRKILLIVRNAELVPRLIPDSALRVKPTVRAVILSNAVEELSRFGEAYKRWIARMTEKD